MDDDSRIAANYFFSAQARTLLASLSLDSVSVEDMERSANFASRLIASSKSKTDFAPWWANDGSELKSIALCRMLLAASNNSYASRMFGEGLAKLCTLRLALEDGKVLLALLSQLYPTLSFDGKKFAMGIKDYLSGPNELAYADIDKGSVSLDQDELLGMAAKLLSNRASDISSIDAKAIPKLARDFAPEFSSALPKSPVLPGSVFAGKWLSQPCMKKILAGVGEGKRYYGSMAISIACQKDGLSKAEASAIMQQYVANCQRSSHDFRESEALATLDWVYKHPTINLSCKMMLTQGLIDSYCPACPHLKRYPNQNDGRPMHGETSGRIPIRSG